MFDKLKDLNRLRKVQGELKRQLEQIFVTEEKKDIKVRVRGDKKIELIEIDGEELRDLRDILNDAFKEVDKKVQKQMKGQLDDLGFPGL